MWWSCSKCTNHWLWYLKIDLWLRRNFSKPIICQACQSRWGREAWDSQASHLDDKFHTWPHAPMPEATAASVARSANGQTFKDRWMCHLKAEVLTRLRGRTHIIKTCKPRPLQASLKSDLQQASVCTWCIDVHRNAGFGPNSQNWWELFAPREMSCQVTASLSCIAWQSSRKGWGLGMSHHRIQWQAHVTASAAWVAAHGCHNMKLNLSQLQACRIIHNMQSAAGHACQASVAVLENQHIFGATVALKETDNIGVNTHTH